MSKLLDDPPPIHTLILIPLVILQLGAVKPLYLCIVNKVLIAFGCPSDDWLFLDVNIQTSSLFVD